MKRLSILSILLLFVVLHFSCEKDVQTKMCYQVKYISAYCPNQDASLVSFTAKNKDATPILDSNGDVIDYQAALLNVPEKFKVPGKIFYVKYHYKDGEEESVPCPAITLPVKVLSADGVSAEDCNSN
ncbi:hypothetical protein ACFOG5_07615 [Pedobacter fastidiosus]|uniref:Uncharacterized protein n=1 Tax=Pedobacter fastidiosus TaxID=2765361 RepID=A0ABR7KPG8_9SPHI|nr:hypothetical protein [Pedobacter fastidiosus]MBC6109977.1 hypothetical protein [Pedobacter fastidiosus]